MNEPAIRRLPLAFDAQVTGMPMARLALSGDADALAGSLGGVVAQARAAGVRHLVTTVSAARTDLANILSHHEFGLVDVAIDFHRPRAADTPATTPDGIRTARPEDAEAVLRECAELFTRSRYYTDRFFSTAEAHELHRRWIRNLFSGRAATILVAEDGEEVVGFAGLLRSDERIGRIDLIAVAPHAAGRGWGRRLVEASLGWFDAHCDGAFVKTQAYNVPACRLYTRHGFTIHQTDLTYSRSLGPR